MLAGDEQSDALVGAIVAALDPYNPRWAAIPNAGQERERLYEYYARTAKRIFGKVIRHLLDRGFLVPLSSNAFAVPVNEGQQFQYNGQECGFTPEGLEWLRKNAAPWPAPPENTADDHEIALGPAGLRALLTPTDPGWADFENPEGMRQLMLNLHTMNDAEALSAMLDQRVARGYLKSRANWRSETEYGMTKKGIRWVESGIPEMPDEELQPPRHLPPAA